MQSVSFIVFQSHFHFPLSHLNKNLTALLSYNSHISDCAYIQQITGQAKETYTTKPPDHYEDSSQVQLPEKFQPAPLCSSTVSKDIVLGLIGPEVIKPVHLITALKPPAPASRPPSCGTNHSGEFFLTMEIDSQIIR